MNEATLIIAAVDVVLFLTFFFWGLRQGKKIGRAQERALLDMHLPENRQAIFSAAWDNAPREKPDMIIVIPGPPPPPPPLLAPTEEDDA